MAADSNPDARSDRDQDLTLIANHAGARSFAPRVRVALRGLGYRLVTPDRDADFPAKPALRIADERQLAKLPDRRTDPQTPIILLTGMRPCSHDDPRVMGGIRRPAELIALYQLLQE